MNPRSVDLDPVVGQSRCIGHCFLMKLSAFGKESGMRGIIDCTRRVTVGERDIIGVQLTQLQSTAFNHEWVVGTDSDRVPDEWRLRNEK